MLKNPSVKISENSDDVIEISLDKPLNVHLFDDVKICIPKYFVSDGASVPFLLWWLLSPQIHPETLIPAIVHDYLYVYQPVTRREADIWFLLACLRNGHPLWKCWAMFFGIRLFGFSHWL